jgi:hypothetical protein
VISQTINWFYISGGLTLDEGIRAFWCDRRLMCFRLKKIMLEREIGVT